MYLPVPGFEPTSSEFLHKSADEILCSSSFIRICVSIQKMTLFHNIFKTVHSESTCIIDSEL